MHIEGRGAQQNPKNRFEQIYIEPDEYTDFADAEEESREKKIETIFFKDQSKTIISKNDSDDLIFDYSVNPYRGCEHGCIYCYARPTHEYLGFSSGIDFESKIMIKEKTAELLRKTFNSKSYKPKVIMFSGNTDCYQPVERKLKLTRAALAVCLEHGNPVRLVTKNALILRDLDILKEMAEKKLVTVMISITTLNRELVRIMEPRTASPQRRLNTVQALAENRVPVGVLISPVIPGLTDKEVPAIIEAAAKAGAKFSGMAMLRLPYTVKDLFLNWINENMPDRAGKIISRIMEIRNGKLNESEFGKRFTGEGEIAGAIYNLYNLSCAKYGMNYDLPELAFSHFRRSYGNQMELF